jgi:chromosome segregation protein
VQLTRLTLHGFKSFGERTTIEFAAGVTAIIGPNGSGKSNVIEALRWASGGGRASEFRAGEKTDLIFHGASGKKGVSYAEVELELEQGSRKLKIQRSLYRDGTSKLKLGGKNARFIDIEEELSGTGLGKNSLAIIGQGEVGQVLMATPEKLLEYVAEAVGVARLANRRVQTEDRLKTVQEHLQRLDDITEELRGQVSLLQEEALQAQRFESLTKERLQLRYTLSCQRCNSLKAEVVALRRQEAELSEQLAQGRAQLAEVQQRWREQRQAVEQLEADYRQILAETESKRGDVRVAEERLGALQRRQQDLQDEHARLQYDSAALQTLSPPAEPESQLEKLEQTLEQARSLLREQEHETTAFESRLAASQQALEQAQAAQRQLEQAIASFHSRQEQLTQQRDALIKRREALGGEPIQLEPLEREAAAAKAARDDAQTAFEQLRQQLQEAQSSYATHRAEHEALMRAAQRSKQAFEARRGYAQGPKHALTSGIAGIYGSVADLMRVPEAYKQAIASSLGRRSEYIVVDTAETAKAVLAHVKTAGGWVTVLPLELLDRRSMSLPSTLTNTAGVIGLASAMVSCEPMFRPVIEQLLGATTLVDTMDTAIRLAKTLTARPRLVTLGGDIMEGYGAMSGGQSRTTAGVIGLAAELEEAERAAQAAEDRAQASQKALTALQQTAQQHKDALAKLEAAYQSAAARLAEAAQQRQVQTSLESELSRQIDQLNSALAALHPPEATVDSEVIAKQAAAHGTLVDKVRASRAQLAKYTQAYQQAQQDYLLAQEHWRQFDRDLTRYQADQARLEKMTVRQGVVAQQLTELASEMASAQALLAQALASLPTDLDSKRVALETAQQHSQALETELATLSDVQAKQAEALESTHVTLARREAALEIAQEEHRQLPDGIQPLELSSRQARERLNSVEQALEALGPVNHRAAIDLGQTQERLTHLDAQMTEARTAAEELAAALLKIDQDTTARLDSAITGLRGSFVHYVQQLFGQEARADIVTEREQGRPKGLHIKLQPPGKQTTALNLLSVGERTMGAMAFLFSLMRSSEKQGLSIAILDEVDAPLDEANIRRFCLFVEQLAKSGTQFILITHQKATFDIADTLWGVTSDRGVSRVFSIRKDAAVAI